MSAYRIGVDIGGTFTDLALSSSSGHLIIEKVLSTPAQPGKAVITGLRKLVSRLEELGLPWQGVEKYLAHGSTIVSNTVIERKGAKTALLTTEGFRDVLEIGREMRFDLFDLQIEKAEPLVPRRLRFGIRGRTEANGEQSEPIDSAEVRRIARALSGAGVQSIAVCLLHSYRNGSQERLVRELVREELGESTSVSISSEIVPEIREFERLSTTVVNAYVKPIVDAYIGDIVADLAALDIPANRLFVMFSNGGLGAPPVARAHPVRMAESGPAAAALGASYFGALSVTSDLLAFDMGGTTAKACLIHDGSPLTTTEGEIARAYHYRKGSGLPIKTPLIEMIEIGSGGGSLARIDSRLGLLSVGPQSAGASPGPACYGLGGSEPTVTDADLLIGYLNPSYFLGGKMTLSQAAAEKAMRTHIAEPSALTVIEAAWRVHDLVNENMANSIRVHCVEQGRDPTSYTLVALGGAGPVHAFNVARKIGTRRIVYPSGAGVLSALGLLVAPVSFDLVRSLVAPLDEDFPAAEVNQLFEEMEAEAVELLHEAGVRGEDIRFDRSADMRYRGQGFEISVPLPLKRVTSGNLLDIEAAFRDAYERRFSRTIPGVASECVNWRLHAYGPRLSEPAIKQGGRDLQPDGATFRKVYAAGTYESWPVYNRYTLKEGAAFAGPALIEENETTVVIGHDSSFSADAAGNLVVTLG